MSMADRFTIPLSNGYRIVSERNSGEFDKELYVGIEDENGSYIQDLAIVRPTYKFKNNDVEFDADRFEILVFGDAEQEDYTNSFIVPLKHDDE